MKEILRCSKNSVAATALILSMMISNLCFAEKNYISIYPSISNYTKNLRLNLIGNPTELSVSEKLVARDVIGRYFSLSDTLRKRLQIISLFKLDSEEYDLVSFKIRNVERYRSSMREDSLPEALKVTIRMSREICLTSDIEVELLNKIGVCASGKDLASQPMFGVLNISQERFWVLPRFIKQKEIIQPISALKELNNNEISMAESEFIRPAVGGYNPVSRNKYSLGGINRGDRICQRGGYSVFDLNGDGKKEIVFVGGYGFNELYDNWQEAADDPIAAFIRNNVVVFELGKTKLIPRLQHEVLSYELRYTIDTKSPTDIGSGFVSGKGVVRESKLYFGDYNDDGHIDYVIRRKIGNLSYASSKGDSAEEIDEKVLLYLGTASGVFAYQDYSNDPDFSIFIQQNVDWTSGFPDEYDCKEKK